METTFREIIGLLKDGHNRDKKHVLLEVFDIILSCTSQDEAKQYFTEEFLAAILIFTDLKSSDYKSIIYKIFINIFSDDDLSENLCSSNATLSGITNFTLKDILDKNSKDADSGCMLLSNITRSHINCERIFNCISPFSETLHQLVPAFTVIGYNPSCSLDQLAMVLCNLSQLTETRQFLIKKNHCVLQRLVPFMNHENAVRRRGIVGVIHNCAFDSSVHQWLLSDEIDILPRLLLPLAGPEQFDDEDNDKLPIELQYLPETKTREHIIDIRKQILETLNQLCATKYGRQFMRNRNAYIILRELHKWEEDSSVLLACENVVDILIRTEEEIGVDHLNTLEIPADLEEKFKNL